MGCGSIAPVERALEHIEMAGRRRMSQLTARMASRDSMIWVLAFIPLVLPPSFALLIAWRRRFVEADRSYDPTWVSLAALTNLFVTAFFVVRFGGDVLALVEGLRHWTMPHLFSPETGPKLTPI